MVYGGVVGRENDFNLKMKLSSYIFFFRTLETKTFCTFEDKLVYSSFMMMAIIILYMNMEGLLYLRKWTIRNKPDEDKVCHIILKIAIFKVICPNSQVFFARHYMYTTLVLYRIRSYLIPFWRDLRCEISIFITIPLPKEFKYMLWINFYRCW